MLGLWDKPADALQLKMAAFRAFLFNVNILVIDCSSVILAHALPNCSITWCTVGALVSLAQIH